MRDLTIDEMIEVFEQLEAHPPVTESYHVRGYFRVWYNSQKEHMLAWFDGQRTHGSGSYTRAKVNNSARTTYNRLLNEYALLWMAEALGESPEVCKKAMNAALDMVKAKKARSSCTAFRKYIPFERIMELVEHPEGWLRGSDDAYEDAHSMKPRARKRGHMGLKDDLTVPECPESELASVNEFETWARR